MLLAHPEARMESDTHAWIRRRTEDPNGRFFVVDRGGECVGFVQLTNWHRIDGYASFGIAFLPEWRGHGIGAAALAQLLSYARQCGVRKLLCEVRCDNVIAIAVYRNLGFREIGVFRRHYDDGERQWDVVAMELLLGDVPP